MRATSRTLRNNSSHAPHQQQEWRVIDDARILTAQPRLIPTRPTETLILRSSLLPWCGCLEGSLHQSAPILMPSDGHLKHEDGERRNPLRTLWDQTSRAQSRAELLKHGPITGPVRPQDVISHEKDCYSLHRSIKHDRRSTCFRRRLGASPLAPEVSPSNRHHHTRRKATDGL